MSEPIRIQVYLARCGLGSRRACEEYVREGRVLIGGRRAVLGSKVREGEEVRLDGRRVAPEEELVYLAVNKPPRVLCSNHDPRGRTLVQDLLEGVQARTFHVGRLDYLSSGLIFYTNDGRFARAVAHPSAGVEKEYLVETREPVPEGALESYRRGIEVQGESYRLKRYAYKTPRKLLLTLVEGKNREIRRVLEALGVRVRRIHRVRIGCVQVQGIPLGGYRRLGRKEVRWFLERRPEAER